MKIGHLALAFLVGTSTAAQAGFFDNLKKDLKKLENEAKSGVSSQASQGTPAPSNIPKISPGRSPGQQNSLDALDKETRRGPIGRLRLGYESLAVTIAEYPNLLPENDPRSVYLRNVAGVMAMASRTPYFYGGLRVLVADTQIENAFAAPGGLILVTTGLLNRLESEDELAGVLGHEIAHIELDHSGYEFKARKSFEYINDGGKQASKANLESQMTSMLNGYSAEIEAEADSRSAEMMIESGYNPYALLRFLERFSGEKAEEIGVKAGETYHAGVSKRKYQGASDNTYAGAKYPKQRASLLLRHFRILKTHDKGDYEVRTTRFKITMGR